MSRTITTAAELEALPVGSVVLGADLPDVPRRPLGERISPRWDPDARWNVDGRHYYGATETVLAVLGGAATVLHDPSTPAPAPSVVPEAAVERAARAMQAENAPKPDPLNRDQREEQDDATIATYRTLARAALTAALPLLTAAPSAVSDAAGLGDRIAALSARLAAVGFPACMCHPGDDDSERCLPSPQDWRAEVERAALSSTTLTAAPSATREAVEAVIFEADDECVLEVHEVRSLADALLARFTITPKEDR